ncbi:hypothetical protein GCM10010461_17140 [Microbacterium aurantiacum]
MVAAEEHDEFGVEFRDGGTGLRHTFTEPFAELAVHIAIHPWRVAGAKGHLRTHELPFSDVILWRGWRRYPIAPHTHSRD